MEVDTLDTKDGMTMSRSKCGGLFLYLFFFSHADVISDC